MAPPAPLAAELPPLSHADLAPLLIAFSAMAQATRLEVVAVLLRTGASGLPAGELAQRVGVPPQTLTFHLKELMAARLLTRTREGRNVRYAVDFPYVRGLSAQFSALCCVADIPETDGQVATVPS